MEVSLDMGFTEGGIIEVAEAGDPGSASAVEAFIREKTQTEMPYGIFSTGPDGLIEATWRDDLSCGLN
jgi:hypothetical protein